MGHVRQISVLFTDLVGSTALSSSVSPEVADEFRREHFGVLRRAIAEADGTEVKNLGDGVMVVFATASAALACAVGMQQGTELDNRDREMPFGLRVGVSAGEAVEEDDDFFGDPVVEAARLCAKCESGQILAADGVRVMAGRRNPYRCVPVGELELKGLPEPVMTVDVAWDRLSADETAQRVPLPARLTSRPVVGVIGRSVEMESLQAAVKRTAAGDGREVVVVAGEAGLGKTTLVAEVARRAFDSGACVLFGHAEEGLATPYGLFAEAFGHLVTHASEDDLRSYVAACGPNLARIVPALTRRLPDLEVRGSDAETDRYLLFAAVVGLLRHITAERSLVLVLDDLQCADTGSLQLLRHLASEDPTLRLLVLGTYRDTEVAAGHPLLDTLGALWRMERVTRLDLAGLDDRGVIELLEATGGQELDDAGVGLAHSVYRETDGNPFFVSEVLRHLVETGALYRNDDGRWVSDLTLDEFRLPDSVREVIGARVGRLDPRASRVLSTAAVIGRDFDLELLARATEIEEDDLLDLLDAAGTAALVTEPASTVGRFSFTHALIQRTLYQDLSPNRRARTHEHVAEALEDLTAGQPESRVGELAHHWANAMRPADTAKAVGYATQAGDSALDALAPAEAVRWYEQALELLDRSADGNERQRAEILVGLGTAQHQAGIAAHRETLLDAARLADRIDAVDLLARAALENSRGWFSAFGLVDQDRIAIIDRALDRLNDFDSPDRARLLTVACAERTYAVGIDERLALAHEAVATARRSEDDGALVEALSRQAAIAVPWTLELRTLWIDEACRLADRRDDLSTRMYAHNYAMTNALERGNAEGIRHHAAMMEADAVRVPQTDLAWMVAFDRVIYAMLRGDLDEADRLAKTARTLGIDAGQPDAMTFWGTQRLGIRYHQGRYGEGIPLIEQGKIVAPGVTVFDAMLACAIARSGNTDHASSLLDAQVASGLPISTDTAWTEAHACWADAAACTRHIGAAAIVRDRIEPYADHVVTQLLTIRPPLAHALGLCDHVLGNYDTGDKWFRRAIHIEEQLAAPLLIAETQAAWAALLADRNQGDDHANARDLATTALDVATARGYGYAEADARAVLKRLA